MLSLSILTASLLTDRSVFVAVPHSRPAIRIEAETHVDFDDVGLLQRQVARLLQRSLRGRALGPLVALCDFAGDRTSTGTNCACSSSTSIHEP